MKYTPSRFPYLTLSFMALWLVASTAAIAWTDSAPDTPYLAFALLVFTTVFAVVNLFRFAWILAIVLGLGIYNGVMLMLHPFAAALWLPLAVGNLAILVAGLLGGQMARQLTALNKQIEHANNVITDLRIKDPVLGMVRLPYALNTLKTEVLRCQRYQSHLCLVLAEIADEDELRKEQGAEALIELKREVGEVLNGMLREMDMLFIADHFGIILPETSTEGALVATKRINESVARKVRVGLHIGVAEFGVDAFSDDELYHAAETALQLAQKTDRAVVNFAQVRFATEEPAQSAA